MDIFEFSKAVGKAVEQDYGIQDGSDLCFNLVESGDIKISDGIADAARVVAQNISQA